MRRKRKKENWKRTKRREKEHLPSGKKSKNGSSFGRWQVGQTRSAQRKHILRGYSSAFLSRKKEGEGRKVRKGNRRDMDGERDSYCFDPNRVIGRKENKRGRERETDRWICFRRKLIKEDILFEMFSSIRSYPKKGGKGTKTSKLKKGLEKEQIPDELRNSNFDKSHIS